MTPIVTLLKDQPLFRSISASAVEELAGAAEWFSLPGGWSLFEQGGEAEAAYFVVSGTLAVVRTDEQGREHVLGYVRAGEPVGEMALISGGRRTASVFAMRDTELLRVDRAKFFRILKSYPDLMQGLSRLVLFRARQNRQGSAVSSPKIFALVAASPSVDIEAYAKDLTNRVRALGRRAIWLGEDAENHPSYFFDEMERTHDVMLLAARLGDSPWFRFALRHADRFWVFARQDARPSRPFPLTLSDDSPARRFRLVDLVMLALGQRESSALDWMDAVNAARLLHWRTDACGDRLARVIAAKSVGVVLSGGGARAYAHVGAIRAIREARIPIDFIGGTSMGGIVAAAYAMGWDDDEIDRRLRQAFVESNPLGDHTLPVVALTKGRLVEERLQRHFDDIQIENLSIPFFCISAELMSGRQHVFRYGLLRRALRASISLPGMLPPVAEANGLFVDGAVINNFPVDVMQLLHRGVTIGVDVAREGTIDPADFDNPPGFLKWIWRNGLSTPPPIANVLMRSATLTHNIHGDPAAADLVIAPEIQGVELRDWRLYDTAVEAGYEATKAALASAPKGLQDLAGTAGADVRPRQPIV